MYYLTIKHLTPGMQLAKSIVGENGNVLLKSGNTLTPTALKRLTDMGFQGAYIDDPMFADVEIDDVINDELRTKAFVALQNDNLLAAAELAKTMVKEMKYKEVLKLDLLDIKNDKNYVLKHSIAVTVFAIVLGMGCGMTQEQLENLAVAGILHDIGKFEIKKRVLNSKKIYNQKDMDEMKKHPIIAYEELKDNPYISSVSRNAILFHHENLDGTGYYSLGQEKIGLMPRILRVADTYDSMTAQKKYRDALAPSEVIEYIMSNAGTLFDRTVVEVFVRKFPIYPIGFVLKLSNGEKAVVVSNERNSMRPFVRTFDGKTIDLANNPNYRSVLIEGIV